MSETLSQQEIDALLRMGEPSDEQKIEVTPEEMDVLEEVGSISIDTAATTTGVTTNGITQQRIDVKPVQFQSFDNEEPNYKSINNIDIILDIPLQVTVELGRTKKEVKDILKLGTGSIIELDKLAGEPVDILVNGKYIARGEVVVIDENFGVRISDIISPSKRIQIG